MNIHRTCQTCLYNVNETCACETGRYQGSPVRSWNTCSSHKAPTPSTAELIARLATCAAGLDWRAEKVAGDCRDYYEDRAAQCRKWAADLKDGFGDLEDIAGDLQEFEALAS